MSWGGSKANLDARIESILQQEGEYVGDVAFFYLPYIAYVLNNYPDTKVICLKRNKHEVVNSYMKKTRRRNHWVKHFDFIWRRCEWDKCYPKYKILVKKEAIKKYWEEYYNTVDCLKSNYPRSIQCMNMREALNTESGIRQLLSFVGIKKKHRVVKKCIKKNSA